MANSSEVQVQRSRARNRLLPLGVALALLLGAGCDSPSDPPLQVSLDAVVQLFVLEGPDTFVLRRIDSTESFYPLNLPAEFQVEGARVHVEGLLIREYRVLLHVPLEITSISPLVE